MRKIALATLELEFEIRTFEIFKAVKTAHSHINCFACTILDIMSLYACQNNLKVVYSYLKASLTEAVLKSRHADRESLQTETTVTFSWF